MAEIPTGISDQARALEQRRNAALAADPHKHALNAAMIARENGDQAALDALRAGELPAGWDPQLAPYLNSMQQVAAATTDRNTKGDGFNGFAAANSQPAAAAVGPGYRSVMEDVTPPPSSTERTRMLVHDGHTRKLRGSGLPEDPLEQAREIRHDRYVDGQGATRDLGQHPETGSNRRSLRAPLFAGSGLLDALGHRKTVEGAAGGQPEQPGEQTRRIQPGEGPTQVIRPATLGDVTRVISRTAVGEGPTQLLRRPVGEEATRVIQQPTPGEATQVITPGESTQVITPQAGPGEVTTALPVRMPGVAARHRAEP